jgi:aspartate 1-decarboxylase
MIRRLVRAAILNATATPTPGGSNVALRIDPIILRAANILPLEEVEIVNMTTGARLATWAEADTDGSGVVRVAGARSGDTIAIVSYGWLHDGQTLNHRAKVVTLDEANRVVSIRED